MLKPGRFGDLLKEQRRRVLPSPWEIDFKAVIEKNDAVTGKQDRQ